MNYMPNPPIAALFTLKQAILKVFYEAREQGEAYLRPDEIRKRLGLPSAEKPPNSANTFVRGILFHLQTEDFVEYIAEKGWRVR